MGSGSSKKENTYFCHLLTHQNSFKSELVEEDCSNYVKIKKILFYLHLVSFKTSDKSSKHNFVLGLKFRLLLKHSGYVIGHEMQDKQG